MSHLKVSLDETFLYRRVTCIHKTTEHKGKLKTKNKITMFSSPVFHICVQQDLMKPSC